MKRAVVCAVLVLLGCAADVKPEATSSELARGDFHACPILPEEDVVIHVNGREQTRKTTLVDFYGADCGIDTLQVSCSPEATTLLCVPGVGLNGWTRETFTLLGGSDVRFDYVSSAGDSFTWNLTVEAAEPLAATP